MTDDAPRLVTVSEFAAISREHEQSIYRRVRLGQQAGVVRLGPRSLRINVAVALQCAEVSPSAE